MVASVAILQKWKKKPCCDALFKVFIGQFYYVAKLTMIHKKI
jgi:hypothetical protein